ncbi:MAG: cytochrome c oxidase subunit II [Candidatus Marinimicrobia bacterium]|jgi:cytochrome c oxidase subunit 2|nr:cytochrome c oxidase subunit II [Candidatus Neomarinimicrobiota bacterium]MDP6853398.1 cytochrome c oxidase subunit II [Candidatus Neomarinimicrobiota bacterium]
MKNILCNFIQKFRQKTITLLPGIWFLDPPKDVSLDGYRIDNVIQYTDLVITIYFSIVVLLMLYFILKYRHRPGHKAVYEKGESKKHIGFTVCMGMLVFLSIDVVIEGMSFRDLKEAFWNFPKGDNVVKVEVMPQQFAWNFRYTGTDGEFGTEDDLIPAQNQMHIPVNTPVVIQIAPLDVIHSFFIPNFRVKVDATPGMVNTMWFQATETGEFEIACAELCGNSHYRMKGILTVESQEDYNNWLNTLEEEGPEDEWEDDDDEGVPSRWGWAWKESE